MNGFAIKPDGSGAYRRVATSSDVDSNAEYYVPDTGQDPAPPVPGSSEVARANADQLLLVQASATAQVNAIKERLEVLEFAHASGEQTQAEAKELTAATLALRLWQTYRVELGRVKTSAGWPISPAWPLAPEAMFSEVLA